MSVESLKKKQLECNIRLGGRQKRKAILMSDSKGRRIEDTVEEGEDILTCIIQGSTKSINYALLTRALVAIWRLHEPLIMIWLGTCDLTQKVDRGFISLNSSIEIGDIMGNFRDFQTKIKSVNKTAEIIILQCPIYSIKLWNEHKRYHDYETPDDKTLEIKVEILNN